MHSVARALRLPATMLFIIIIIIIKMAICKAPTSRLKVLNKHNIHNMEIGNVMTCLLSLEDTLTLTLTLS